jgi:histidine triad (HIT) family protein
MNQKDCIFCRMVSGEIPVAKVYEDDVVLAFLDIGPVSDGHTLLIPKEHFAKLEDCPAEMIGKVASRLGRISAAVVEATGADGYNVLCNNGRAAGQLVEHLHFHIIPRKTGDGVFDRWPAFKYPQGKIEKLAEQIRQVL